MIFVSTGPMFSGKSESLWRVYKSAKHPVAFKPAVDTRDATDCFVTHAGNRVPCHTVATAGDILSLVPAEADVVLIDEGQFFGSALIPVAQVLAHRGLEVFVACLDMDCHRLPFGAVGDLLAVAYEVQKCHASCAVCGAPAPFSYRKVSVSGRDFIGGAEAYEPRCEVCFENG